MFLLREMGAMAEKIFIKRDTPIKRAIIEYLLEVTSSEPFSQGSLENALEKKGIIPASIRPQIGNLLREKYLHTIPDLGSSNTVEQQSKTRNKPGRPGSRSNVLLVINEEQKLALKEILDMWDGRYSEQGTSVADVPIARILE